MRKALVVFALLAIAFTPAIGWTAAMSDDVNRDTTPGDPFELMISPFGTSPVGQFFSQTGTVDPIPTQEVFYAVRGADDVIYYTIQDICPDELAACAAGQAMRAFGVDESNMDPFIPGFAAATNRSPFLGALPFAFGVNNVDFGGEFFAGTSYFGMWNINRLIGPGTNGDPVLTALGDLNHDGWAGSQGQTPWLAIPTGCTADNDPSVSYMTGRYPNQWYWINTLNPWYELVRLDSDPLRPNVLISPFDIIIEVRGNDGGIYRTAYNLNATIDPPTFPINVPDFGASAPGAGAAMAFIDRVFPGDESGACTTSDGFPGCASRYNPNNGTQVIFSGQEQSPWRPIANVAAN